MYCLLCLCLLSPLLLQMETVEDMQRELNKQKEELQQQRRLLRELETVREENFVGVVSLAVSFCC